MTRITWGDPGTREFEAGCDRGVLFIGETEGIPWNGLKNVSVEPKKAEAQPYYMDGVMYMRHVPAYEIEGSIAAFTSPPEFDKCEGTLEYPYGSGLFLSQQRREEFHFSWRTGLGNDLEGLDRGYKIHLLYNALAEPGGTSWTSLSDSPQLAELSWKYTTRPVATPAGVLPTAHIAVNSTRCPPGFIHHLEALLYGTKEMAGRIVSISEIVSAMKAWGDAWELQQPVTIGYSDISIAGIPDLMGDVERGIFTRPLASRLHPDSVAGLNILES